jgi:hypothetical protein
MRQYLPEQWVAWGAVLVAGTTCALARGQAPRQAARVVPSASAPATPVGMGMPQTYTPPTAPVGPMGLTALAPSYSAAGAELAGELLPPGPTAPAGVNPLAAAEPENRRRFAFPNLFKKSREATSAAPQATAPQPAPQVAATRKPQPPAAQSGPAPANQVISTTAPLNGAMAQLVGAQSPAGLPNGPVIICMPAGWQPPADFSFAPRQVSPEVTEEFWPVSSTTRNPLGSSEPGGMFRWPRFAKEADAAPAPREPSKALVTAQPAAGSAAASASPEVDTTPPWKKILMARSHGHEVPQAQGEAVTTAAVPQGPAPSKALFSLGRKPQGVAAPVAAGPAAGPAPARVAQTSAPMSEPARAPAPPTVARREPSASRIPTSVPRAPARLVADSKNPKLQWRAKGAPRESVIEEIDAPVDGGSRVVAHTEAARGSEAGVPTPADPALDPEHAGEPPPAPGFEGAPVPQVVGPQPMAATAAPAVPAAPVRSKALIPSSFFSGQPKVPAAPPEPAMQLTSAPQRGAPALVNIVPKRPIPRPMPQIGVAAGNPAAATGAVAAAASSNKALLPKMFVEYSPSQISLSTKPSAVPTPVGMQTPVATQAPVVTQPSGAVPQVEAQEPSEAPQMPAPPRIARTHRHSGDDEADEDAHDSYYAPPVKHKGSKAERPLAAEEPDEEAASGEREARPSKHFKRSSPHPREFRPAEPGAGSMRSGLAQKGDARAARNRSYAAPREIPPLARPFWAISEMTKLPKFVTALTGGGAAAQEPRVTNRAPQPTLARRAEPREAMPREAPPDSADEAPRTVRARQAAEETDEMTEADADEIAERPSKRRKHAEADDELEAEDDKPRKRAKDEPKAKLARHDDEDAETIAPEESSAEDDDEREADADRPQRKPSPRSTSGPSARRQAEVKVVSGEESAGSSISRSKVVRMRKKDGSSVIVYYVAKQPAEADGAEAEASSGTVAEPQASKPAPAARRVVRPATDASAKKLRDNPLR